MTGTHNGPGNCLHGKPMRVDNCEQCKVDRGEVPEGNFVTVIDTKEGIEAFAMLQVIGALSLEVNGMSFSNKGSVLKLAQQRYGIKSRRKALALVELRELYKTTFGIECNVGAPR